MTCVKRMSFLIVLSSLIQLPTSEATEVSQVLLDMWARTGCSNSVPEHFSQWGYWQNQADSGAGDMYAYCDLTLNDIASTYQRALCGTVAVGCSLQASAGTFDEIETAINSNTAVTIRLTADIESFTEMITIGTGKTVTIVSVDGQKTLTAASSNRFFNVQGSLTLERITLNNV